MPPAPPLSPLPWRTIPSGDAPKSLPRGACGRLVLATLSMDQVFNHIFARTPPNHKKSTNLLDQPTRQLWRQLWCVAVCWACFAWLTLLGSLSLACVRFRPHSRPRAKMEGAADKDGGGQQSLLCLARVPACTG